MYYLVTCRPLDETVKHATIDSLKEKTALPLQLYQQLAIASTSVPGTWYFLALFLSLFMLTLVNQKGEELV